MYEKPQLQRFGTFRELTKFGPDSGSDIGSIFGIAGCSAENAGSELGCPTTPGRGSR